MNIRLMEGFLSLEDYYEVSYVKDTNWRSSLHKRFFEWYLTLEDFKNSFIL